jgi:hypothetical protein
MIVKSPGNLIPLMPVVSIHTQLGHHSIKTFSDLVADINDGSVRSNLPNTILSQPCHLSEGQYKVFECLSLDDNRLIMILT